MESQAETAYATKNNGEGNMQLHAPCLYPQAVCELTETDAVGWRHGRASDRRDNSQ